MTDDLQARFDAARTNVRKLSKRPDNLDLLKLYALFKQATEGDCVGDRPGMTQMVARAKYDAWKALEGVSRQDAMTQYAEHAEGLIAADGG